MEPISKGYAGVGGLGSLVFTFLFLLMIRSLATRGLDLNVRRFAGSFAGVFAALHLCWAAGHYAHVAATPDKLDALGISWSLNLTGEAGSILASLAGLVVGNFLPKTTTRIGEATKPELYIKTAIVIMGAGLGVKAVEAPSLALAVIFRGLCAIAEAYLIYWAVVYLVARKYFGFSREWAAPLAFGNFICGVSAAIATGGAIRAHGGSHHGVVAGGGFFGGRAGAPAVRGFCTRNRWWPAPGWGWRSRPMALGSPPVPSLTR